MAQPIAYPYGAFELKKTYQRNMLLGTTATLILVLLVSFGVWLYRVITYEDLQPTNVIRIKTIAELGAPPSLAAKPPQVNIDKPQVAAPKVGIPTPVADDEVADEEIALATREELQEINAPVFDPNAKSSDIVIDIPDEEYMPSPDEFIPMEVYPESIYEEEPEYPRLALESGFTGYVIIQAYVDKDGNVKKALPAKTDRPGIGFEEAAVKAALKYKYKPGIQNGIPTGCWVSYTVKFKLKGQ